MRNDEWFRIHYPYGIVLDLENKSYALFNRHYKRLGEDRDIERIDITIPQLLHFQSNENVNEELQEKLKQLVKRNPFMYCAMAEEHFFRVWLYNDASNPYAHKKVNSRHYKNYIELLDYTSNLLGQKLTRQIITL